MNDIKVANPTYNCFLICLEIGSRGFLSKDNKAQINRILSIVKVRKSKPVYIECSKLALLGSYAIYNARFEPNWVTLTDL